MPYLKKENKEYFSELLQLLGYHSIANGGELNFLFTEIIKQYLVTHELKYEVMNTVVGALESCKAEFQRRIVNPYEDVKIELNGDVYTDNTKKVEERLGKENFFGS